jgi:colicin import membrane protein
MKLLLAALSAMALLAGAQAQETAPLNAPDTKAERARIETDRAREQARYDKEEADCYQRFAVNDCLREVKVRRRATFEALRRQEIILNDADRKKQAAEQLRQIEEKAAERAQDDAQKAQQAPRQAKEKPANGKRTGGVTPQVRASSSPALTPEQRAQEKKAYEEKLLKAQERKAQRDKALAEKTAPPAKPLPTPP